MPVTIKNTNADGRFSMALKVGDVCILPGEEATLEELASIVEVSTDPKMKILAEIKANEMKEKAEARKKAKESFAPEYVWDPYQKRPCCVCPPCAIFGPCIDDMIHPDFPGSALFCFPCQMVCGKLTHPVCIGHCKFFQLCDCCVNCRCSCCPPSCTCCNITCPPACLYNCCKIPSCCSLPKCSCCPPSCEWCGVKCPPTCCSLPKCLNCCPPTCKWCGIQCPPQCLLDCLSFCLSCKAVGCSCVLCHFTCTAYPKCCPACLFCADETIKVNENKLIVKGKLDVEDVQLNKGAAGPVPATMARVTE